jgi:hypothetical protein
MPARSTLVKASRLPSFPSTRPTLPLILLRSRPSTSASLNERTSSTSTVTDRLSLPLLPPSPATKNPHLLRTDSQSANPSLVGLLSPKPLHPPTEYLPPLPSLHLPLGNHTTLSMTRTKPISLSLPPRHNTTPTTTAPRLSSLTPPILASPSPRRPARRRRAALTRPHPTNRPSYSARQRSSTSDRRRRTIRSFGRAA